MIHTLQVLQEVYTGELPETRRESEPYSCKFTVRPVLKKVYLS